MYFIYDHLIASMLGAAIFFILLALQLRANETRQDQTRYYAAKTHLLQVQEMIEHDFGNAGSGVGRYDDTFLTKNDSTIEFMAKVLPEDTDPSKITYRRVATEVVELHGEEVQLYEIRRLIDDVLSGKSPDTMRSFDVMLWNSNREEAADFDDVVALHVEFVVAPQFNGDDALHEARWNRTFWPTNLSNF